MIANVSNIGLQTGIHDALQLKTHCLESLARLNTAVNVDINSYFFRYNS